MSDHVVIGEAIERSLLVSPDGKPTSAAAHAKILSTIANQGLEGLELRYFIAVIPENEVGRIAFATTMPKASIRDFMRAMLQDFEKDPTTCR